MLAIEDNVGVAPNAGDAEHRKADHLVEADPHVEDRDRHNQRINDRRDEQVPRIALAEICR